MRITFPSATRRRFCSRQRRQAERARLTLSLRLHSRPTREKPHSQDCAKLYADYLPKRYKKAVLQQAAAAGGTSATDAQSAFTFETNEGKATLEIQGSDLLILEGYDDK